MTMSDAFFLRAKLDRPFVEQDRPEDVFALLTIEPNPSVLAGAGPMPTHLLMRNQMNSVLKITGVHRPVFIAHGRRDPVMEVAFARHARDVLQAAGLPVSYHESDAAHHIDPAHVPAAIAWLGDVLSS